MKKLRIGIIGCGVIAETHAWAIEQDPRAELTALCDLDNEKMIRMNSRRNCRLFNHWADMLASGLVDAAAICLPHALHEPAIIDALAAGKHVICEKPLGVSIGQLNHILSAADKAEKHGVYSFGIFQHRYSPLVEAIRSALSENALGEIQSGEIRFRCTRTSDYYEEGNWRGTWNLEGGGTLINQGIHTLDILQYLLGKPEKADYQLSRQKIRSIEVEDKGTGKIYYPRHLVSSGMIELDFENDLVTDWDPRIILKGSKAVLEINGSHEFSTSNQLLHERLIPYTEVEQEKAPGKSCYGSLHNENYRDILNALESYEKGEEYSARVSLSDLAATTETVLALYQSHFQNQTVLLPVRKWKNPEKLEYTGS